MKEPIAFRAKQGTRARLAELARRTKKKPYTLAGELLEAALAIAEAAAPAPAKDKGQEQAA